MTDVERWNAVWTALGAKRPLERRFAEVAARYAEPWRAYHGIEHVRHGLAELAPARRLARRPAEVEAALWFHDAVYDPRRGDNEERSAEWARATAEEAGLRPEVGERLAEAVLATKHHRAPPDSDACLLIDVDLSILGADPARFEAYERGIRREFGFLGEEEFRAGRAEVLRRFLARPWIYRTPFFASRYETRARQNLRAALDRLTRGEPPRPAADACLPGLG